jgi:GT2 family glycosyltransferase
VAAELAVIVVSYNSRAWLRPCLASVAAHAGGLELDVVVVDNASSDGSAELVEAEFPDVRVLRARNGGFAYGNNRGLLTVDAPYVLFMNADAEIVDGTLAELVGALRDRPEVGLAGCRQLDHDGQTFPTIRRFPTPSRLLAEALGAEQLPGPIGRVLGQRELDAARYDRETSCDWVSGSFMIARREAVLGAGMMDERLFLYCEEPDLCLRLKRAGWDVRYLPQMTVLHAFGRAGFDARMVAQEAYAHRQYADNHFHGPRRLLAITALTAGHALRALVGCRDRAHRADSRRASRLALRTLLGLAPPPFGPPAPVAVAAEPAGVVPEPVLQDA